MPNLLDRFLTKRELNYRQARRWRIELRKRAVEKGKEALLNAINQTADTDTLYRKNKELELENLELETIEDDIDRLERKINDLLKDLKAK